MMDFKKRALILTLAATISVTGSFAADNYKNCLMNMEFKSAGANEIDLVLNTKKPYNEVVVPVKKDASTFVIMLPETDNQSSTPNLSDAADCIESVEVRKMPYSEGHKGYTKILIKTSGPINLNTSTALYVPSHEIKEISRRPAEEENYEEQRERRNTTNPNNSANRNAYKNGKRENPNPETSLSEEKSKRNSSDANYNTLKQDSEEQKDDNATSAEESAVSESVDTVDSGNTSYQQYMLGLLVLFIIITSIYFYTKAQDKLTNVMGEKLEIDIDENTKNEQKKNKQKSKIRKTINKLDDIYSKTASESMNTILSAKQPAPDEEDSQEELNIVDLDALFKEKQSEKTADSEISPEEADALDDFLSGFSFDDSELKPEKEDDENVVGYDEEAYEKLLSSKGIVFSKADIACFNALMASEISDTTLNDIDKYAVSNPIAGEKPSQKSVLEKLVTDYTVFQNITFNSEDINILKKLISVELDPDFLSDLRTNSERTTEMEKEIISPKTGKKKPSEILTLNVKELLPNLSEALRKQGNKPIESEAQPETVYFSEGYEVSTLSADFDLPDLAKEIKNRKAQVSTPSADIQTVDYSYSDSVQKLSITGLPDLEDVAAHPEKYAEEKIDTFVADESTLLNSIMNVQFKPFDDGTRSFEIINNDIEDVVEENSPSIDDIRNEFSQFGNFDVADSDNSDDFDNNTTEKTETPVYSADKTQISPDKGANEGVNEDANNKINEDINSSENETLHQEDILNSATKITRPVKSEINKIKALKQRAKQRSEELMSRIEKLREERCNRKTEAAVLPKNTISASENITKTVQNPSLVKCIIEGINYNIVDSVSITESAGCYLAKCSNGYAVLAYNGSEVLKIKEYTDLKVEKITARQNNMLNNGASQYLIKIGTNKFLAELKDDKINYVMDL